MRWRTRTNGRTERGASAVEFALVLPILLVVVLGIINFGFVFAQQISLNNGARQAARFAVVDGRDCGQIQDEGKSGAATIGMTGTAVPTPVIERGTGSTFSGAPCPRPCAGSQPGQNVRVTMTRSAAWVVPFPPLFTAGNAPTLRGTGVMRCEYS